MKILHLTTWENGGAAIAASRLSQGLKQLGVESQLVHMSNKLPAYIDALIGKLHKPSNQIFHSYNYFGENLQKKRNEYLPDLVHIHWVGAGFIRPESLVKWGIPIVWTLHDLWALSGAEHLPGHDSRFTTGYLKSNRTVGEGGLDLDRFVWERKREAWRKVDINFVAPSKYVEKMAKQSPLLAHHSLRTIYNGINLNEFRRVGERDPFTVLVCAPNILVDHNKGLDLLAHSVNALPSDLKSKIVINIIGAETPNYSELQRTGVKVKYLGIIESKSRLRTEYSRAALTIIPSRLETLSYVTIESLACGTPVVAFKVGGIPEVVKNGLCGYLAKPYDTADLAKGIVHFIRSKSARMESVQARVEHIRANFTVEKMTKAYHLLYEGLI